MAGGSGNDPAVSELNWDSAFTPGISSNFVVAPSRTHDENGVKTQKVKANEKSSRKIPKLRER